MRQWIVSALVQITACRLFDTKPLSKPNAGLLSIGSLGTHFSEIFYQNKKISFTILHMKISSTKWLPFCPGGRCVNLSNLEKMAAISHNLFCDFKYTHLKGGCRLVACYPAEWAWTPRTPARWRFRGITSLQNPPVQQRLGLIRKLRPRSEWLCSTGNR